MKDSRFQSDDPAAGDEFFRSLVEAAGDIIYILDCNGCFTFVNPALEPILGHTRNEVLGRPFVELLTSESAAIATKHYRQGLEGATRTPFFEVDALRKAGGTVRLEIRAGSLYRDGALVGRQGIARDISELKALQVEVAEKTERITLLEGRARTAMQLYAQMLDVGGSGLSSGIVDQVVQHLEAEKAGLSPGDLKIIALLARGLSTREIAAVVHRSPNTVKDQVKKMMQRLGAKRRAEVVAMAHDLGLVARRDGSDSRLR